MFNRFATGVLSWIQGVLQNMLGQTSIQQAFSKDLGLNFTLSSITYNNLQKWSALYSNQANHLNEKVVSMRLAGVVSREIARTVTNEMSIEMSGGARAEYIEAQLEKALPEIKTRQIEYGCAKGGLFIKPYLDENYELCLDYIQADMAIPISFNSNGHITACVFSYQVKQDQYFYTRLELHKMEGRNCIVRNVAYRSTSPQALGNNIPLTMVNQWAELQPESIIQNVTAPLFGYFRYPRGNSEDNLSPLGASCFELAVDYIKQADNTWSQLLWEMESGERALFVDTSAFSRDENDKPILPHKRLYRTLQQVNALDVSKQGFFQEWSPQMREANYITALDAILKKIELTCGLASGTLSDPNVNVLTATEIIISKQRTASTIVDTQTALEEALEQVAYAIDVLATIYYLAPAGTYDAVYSWDDSIVSDHDTKFNQDTIALDKGTMSKTEWRMRTYGETEEIAREKIQMVQAESTAGFAAKLSAIRQ